MEDLAAKLVNKRKIFQSANGGSSPISIHKIDAFALEALFRRIITPLIAKLFRETNISLHPHCNDNDPGARQELIPEIAQSIAWAAVCAAQNEIQKKDDQFGLGYLTYGSFSEEDAQCELEAQRVRNEAVGGKELFFPRYFVALIDSIGPVLHHSGPLGRLHVPVLESQAVTMCGMEATNERGAGYWAHYMSSILDSSVEHLRENGKGMASSGWWLFWPHELGVSIKERDPIDDCNFLPILDVFSPFGSDEVENHLKLAVLYAQTPLVSHGVGPYSTSPWYYLEGRTTGPSWPSIDEFPEEAHQPLYFWEGSSAHVGIIERCTFTTAGGQTCAPSNAWNSWDSEWDLSHRAGSTGRAHTSSEAVQGTICSYTNRSARQDASLASNYWYEFRIKYFYFDHKALDRVTPEEYMSWVHEMHPF